MEQQAPPHTPLSRPPFRSTYAGRRLLRGRPPSRSAACRERHPLRPTARVLRRRRPEPAPAELARTSAAAAVRPRRPAPGRPRHAPAAHSRAPTNARGSPARGRSREAPPPGPARPFRARLRPILQRPAPQTRLPRAASGRHVIARLRAPDFRMWPGRPLRSRGGVLGRGFEGGRLQVQASMPLWLDWVASCSSPPFYLLVCFYTDLLHLCACMCLGACIPRCACECQKTN